MHAGASVKRGDAIDRFTVLDRLGEGGMGLVVAAYDPRLERRVAIKLWRAGRSGEADDAQMRLVREAQAMARLNHPNVITVYEVGTHGDDVFVAMEIVDGGTLARWRDEPEAGRPSWREAVAAYLQAGAGLAAAHRAGLVHRDFKPDNVLVGKDGKVRVTDFGLAGVDGGTLVEGSPGSLLELALTNTGAIVGTPAYMAPEQHRGERADARADQFSFCVALWEALHGTRPFVGKTPAQILDKIAGRRFGPPRHRVPGWLDGALRRGLAARPADRWPSMDALLSVLRRAPVRRRRLLAAIGAAAVLAAMVAALATRGRRTVDCDRAGDAVARVWTPEARAAVQRALTGADPGYTGRVVARLDEAAHAWRAAAGESCRATYERGAQSGALLDRRALCLGGQLADIEALAAALGHADAVAQSRALDAARALPAPDSCSAAALAEAAPAPADARAREIDLALARALAAERLGQVDDAMREVTAAVSQARAADYPALLARALALQGSLLSTTDTRRARELLEEAVVQAADSRDPAVEARVAVSLVEEAAGEGQGERLVALLPVGMAALRRVRFERPLLAEGLLAQAYALGVLGRYGAQRATCVAVAGLVEPGDLRPLSCRCKSALMAREPAATGICREALVAAERENGPRSIAVAIALDDLSVVLRRAGDVEETIATARRSFEIASTALGESSQPALRALRSWAAALCDAALRCEEAIPLAERGLRAVESFRGRTGVTRSSFLSLLATAHEYLGHVPEARRYADESLADAERVFGPDHPDLAVSMIKVADAYLEPPRDLDRSVSMYLRAAAHVARTNGPGTHLRGVALVSAANALAEAGRFAEALAHIEAAMPIVLEIEKLPYNQATARAVYGQVLLGVGERARARVQIEQALAGFASIKGADKEVKRATALLRKAGGQPR